MIRRLDLIVHLDAGIPEDRACFAQLLRLWDGLCGWEEGSSTPVLHIGWAQPFVSVLGKFPATTRKGVNIVIWEDPASQSKGQYAQVATFSGLKLFFFFS